MKKDKIVVRVKMAWWWPYYTAGVVAMCRLTGMHPHEERVGYWCRKAMRLEVIHAPSTEDT